MKSLYVSVLFILLSLSMKAQSEIADYNWEEKPEVYKQSDEQKEIPEYLLSSIVKKEFLTEEGAFIEYALNHSKTIVNSDEAIGRNNKVYFSTTSGEELVKNELRIITPEGKVTELNQDDIKQSTDEATGSTTNYFAIKGLEKGCIIEYLTLTKGRPVITGYPLTLQFEFPVHKMDVEIIYPDYLEFETLITNDETEITKSSEKYEEKISESFVLNDVKPLWEERYSSMEKYRKKFFFKMISNTSRGKYNLNSYTAFVDQFKESIKPLEGKVYERPIEKFMKDIEWSGDLDKDIVKIENKVKTDFRILEQYNDGVNFLRAFRSKNLSVLNATKLFATIFASKDIPFEYVLTSNRMTYPFLKEFESYSFLKDIGFYFPTTKGYMGVKDNVSHYPVLFHNWMNTYGLFIKKEKIGNNELYMGEVRFIDIPDADFTMDYQDITVDFTEDLDNPKIDTKLTFNGFAAYGIQPIFDYASAEEQEKFLKEFSSNYSGLNSGDDSECEVSAQNKGREMIFEKPLIMDISFNGKDLIEKAGNTRIFSVGLTIGKQVELYQKEERLFPIEMDYPHTYHRNITLILPEGYSVKNLDDLNADHTLEMDGKEVAKFETTYIQEGNKVMIKNMEFYKQVDFPISVYDTYSKVINAAADFNKIKLVVEK